MPLVFVLAGLQQAFQLVRVAGATRFEGLGGLVFADRAADPYYEGFAAWARQVLSQHGQARYSHMTGRAIRTRIPVNLAISFVPQHGPYADLTSVLNGADHLASPGDLYVAFADNLYASGSPLTALRDSALGQVVVLARAYQPELAAHRGVITTTRHPGGRLMLDLTERPGPAAARALEHRYGTGNLLLLEGRARLTADFVRFARTTKPPRGAEPKLALALAANARTRPVQVVETTSDVTDLGAPSCTEPATVGAGKQTA